MTFFSCIKPYYLHKYLWKNYALLFLVLSTFLSPVKAQTESCSLSKKYATISGQYANKAYEMAENGYFIKHFALSNQYIDTSIFYIGEAIAAIDSAIFFAKDTDLVALDHARMSKYYSKNTYSKLMQAINMSNLEEKRWFAKQATFLAADATIDAYHAALFFTDTCRGKKTEESKPEEKKEVPVQKPITKLDVDQTLFALLSEQLNQKALENRNQINKLNEQLKTEKNPAQIQKIKNQLKELELKEADFANKNKGVADKLNTINQKIDERDKVASSGNKGNNANGNNQNTDDNTVFSKSMKDRPADEWNKQVLMDAPLPETLIYQVQIGVYKQSILPQVFKGLKPLYGRKSGDGVSYSTGLFEKFEDANQAKDYVKSMGLKDAFIVAYYNNKKITATEARKLEKK